MTFGEQLKHIRQNIEWLSSTYLNFSFDAVAKTIRGIKEEYLNEKVNFFAGEKTNFNHKPDAESRDAPSWSIGGLSEPKTLLIPASSYKSPLALHLCRSYTHGTSLAC